jgi:hypothetical protein
MDKLEQAKRTILYTYRHHWRTPAYVCRFCGRAAGMPHTEECQGVRALKILTERAHACS